MILVTWHLAVNASACEGCRHRVVLLLCLGLFVCIAVLTPKNWKSICQRKIVELNYNVVNINSKLDEHCILKTVELNENVVARDGHLF